MYLSPKEGVVPHWYLGTWNQFKKYMQKKRSRAKLCCKCLPCSHGPQMFPDASRIGCPPPGSSLRAAIGPFALSLRRSCSPWAVGSPLWLLHPLPQFPLVTGPHPWAEGRGTAVLELHGGERGEATRWWWWWRWNEPTSTIDVVMCIWNSIPTPRNRVRSRCIGPRLGK